MQNFQNGSNNKQAFITNFQPQLTMGNGPNSGSPLNALAPPPRGFFTASTPAITASVITEPKKWAKKFAVSMTQSMFSDPYITSNPLDNRNQANFEKKYELATHTVKVLSSGSFGVNSLWEIQGGISSGISMGDSERIERVSSMESFNFQSQANEMLNRLSQQAFSGAGTDPEEFGKLFLNVCGSVHEILSKEGNLLRISSPAYVLGDIQGNFPDLICFEKTLWRLGPLLTPANFLFLGNFLGFGCHGLEVIGYLFSQKILAPNKFFLLRGNHEVRQVQQMFNFYEQCLTSFGDRYGPAVWNAINECFDVMPLAAIVDGMVFCVHGGIPPPWFGGGLVNAINEIPKHLPDPEKQSSLAWELMWNDPIRSEDLPTSDKGNRGFFNNTESGTAHVFTAEALEAFLRRNSLSHVIRGHEVQQAGFKVQLNEKLLTVFSSSKYCGGSNEAACILADRLKLRTIRLDTS